jgi:hypothetical protein
MRSVDRAADIRDWRRPGAVTASASAAFTTDAECGTIRFAALISLSPVFREVLQKSLLGQYARIPAG